MGIGPIVTYTSTKKRVFGLSAYYMNIHVVDYRMNQKFRLLMWFSFDTVNKQDEKNMGTFKTITKINCTLQIPKVCALRKLHIFSKKMRMLTKFCSRFLAIICWSIW